MKNASILRNLQSKLGEVPSMDEASTNIAVPETPVPASPARRAEREAIPLPPRHRPTASPHERWDRYDGRVRRTDRIISKTFKFTPEFEGVLRDNCHRLNLTQIEVLELALMEFNIKYAGQFVD
jgi:hypothetical protein